MKLYQGYKKLYRNVLLWALILLFVPLVFSYAQTAEEVRNQINQKSADIAKLEEEIRAYQKELDSLGKEKVSLSGSIKQLDLTKKKLNTDISVTQSKIDKTNLTIQSLSSDIGSKENSIDLSKESIAAGIRRTNEFETKNVLQTLLSRSDFTEVWTDIDNMATV